MVSCIEIKTVALVFASLSLISSSLGSLVPIAMMVYINVLNGLIGYLNETVPRQVHNINQLELVIEYYDLYFKVGVGFTLSIMFVSLIFSIILIKGLLSKKAHLVKAYHIYGVIANSISALIAFLVIVLYNTQIGLLSLLGCFLYGIILIMIERTYQKLTTKDIQFCHKKLEIENQTA